VDMYSIFSIFSFKFAGRYYVMVLASKAQLHLKYGIITKGVFLA
jgi:hypothetical protein